MKIPFLKSKQPKGDGESTAVSSSSPSQSGEKKEIEVTPLEETEALDKLDDENEYPSGAKLAIITASLCLSVFLMALVSQAIIALDHAARCSSDFYRTIQLLQPLFRK